MSVAYTIQDIIKKAHESGNPEKAEHSKGFFKTGPGEYGEGDKFIGLTVPQVRSITKLIARTSSKDDILKLMSSEYHELRLMGILIIVYKYEQEKDLSSKEEWVQFYLQNTQYINNWDLVDSSAHKILGDYCLLIGSDDILYRLSDSKNMWEQRMSVIANHAHVRVKKPQLVYELSEKFLNHPHDLMHKATGWLLREAGKRDRVGLNAFLENHAATMPRTMLRYALEKHDKPEKDYFMNLKNSII